MSDLLDVAPQLPRYGEEGNDALLQGRQPGMGEYLGANVQEGWWNTVPGVVGTLGREVQGERADPTPMTREAWEASGYARLLGPAWDERMTRGRAEAQARTYDENAYRKALMGARDPGAFEAALGFGGQLVGSLFDPVNFLPIGGPLERGLTAVGAIRAAEVLGRPGVAASALRGAVEAVGGNALAAPAVYGVQSRYGEEITFDKVLADLAIGAVIGAGFGTVGGLMSRRVQLDATTAVRTVDAAASDLAAGRPMEMPASLATRGVEDAVMRAAPQEMVGLGLADLPAGANGAPMTRAEFDAWAAETGRGGEGPVGILSDIVSTIKRRVEAGTLTPGQARDLLATVAGIDAPTRAEIAQRARAGAADGAARRELAGLVDDIGRKVEDGTLSREKARAILDAVSSIPERRSGAQVAEAAAPPLINGERAPAAPSGEAPSPASLIPAGAERAAPDAPATRGDGAAIEPAAAPAAMPPTPETAAASREAMAAESYAWYREALDARRGIERMAAAPPAPTVRPDAEPRAQAEESPGLPGPERQHIEQMRAEGRLTAADEAILRAGDEQAAELQGVAKGLKEAGECLLRNMA